MDSSSDENSSAYYYHYITELSQSVTKLAIGLESCNHSITFPLTTLKCIKCTCATNYVCSFSDCVRLLEVKSQALKK